MNEVNENIKVFESLGEEDLIKIRSNDAVIACDYLPINDNAIEVLFWDEALQKGYDEPKFENSDVLVLDNELGTFEHEGKKYHQVPLVIHESVVQRP